MVCNVLLPSSSSSCDHVYIIRIYIHSLLQGTGSLHTCHSLSISLSLSHSLSLSLSLLPIHAYLFRVCFASFSRKLASHACFVHAVLLFCHSSNRDYSNSVSFLRFYLSSYRLFYLTYFFFFFAAERHWGRSEHDPNSRWIWCIDLANIETAISRSSTFRFSSTPIAELDILRITTGRRTRSRDDL